MNKNVITSLPFHLSLFCSIGDVNSNGTVNIVAALLAAQYYMGLEPGNFDASVVDVNCNGGIDIVDALLIAQYYLNMRLIYLSLAAPNPGLQEMKS